MKAIQFPENPSYGEFMNAPIDQTLDSRPPMWDMALQVIRHKCGFTHETFALYLIPLTILVDDKTRLALAFLCNHGSCPLDVCAHQSI
jgi:hypothetical protein